MLMTLAQIRKIQQKGDLKTAREALEQLLSTEAAEHPALMALYGVILFQADETEKGRRMIQGAAKILPEYSDWASDLGFGLFLINEPDQARQMLEKAVKLPGPDSIAFNRLGVVYHVQEEVERAADTFQEALLRDPDQAEAHHNLGVILTGMGNLEEALVHFERALTIQPEMTVAEASRASILVALERADEAIIEIESRLKKHPEAIHIRRYLSRVLEASGRFEEACAELKEASGIAPENTDLMVQLAGLLFKRERYAAALVVLLKAAGTDPENLNIQNLLVRAYSEVGQHDKAREIIEKALEKRPNSPSCLLTRAVIHSNTDNFTRAEEDLKKVVEGLPGSAEAWGLLGHIFILTGRMEEAVKALERAAELNPAALAGLINARSFPDDPGIVERMSGFANNPIMHREPRAAMGFALASLFENQEKFDQAFDWVKKANSMIWETISYDQESWHQYINQLREIFIPDIFHKFTGQGASSKRPLFIVGMPRSGTTLTEQILSSHPDVFGAGELGFLSSITWLMPQVIKTDNPYPYCMHLFQKWMAKHAATYYFKKIDKMNGAAARVADKMPHNFLHLGLIAIIFPNAKIIHVKRDPRDVAVSNYFTNFKHKYRGLSYAFDLTAIGHMINDYLRMMDHWRAVLPVPVLEIQYEDLIANPEEKIRNLISFVDLEWDDIVLEFYKTSRPVKTASAWQVRQPMYTSSIGRWKKYEKFLGPFLEVTGAFNS